MTSPFNIVSFARPAGDNYNLKYIIWKISIIEMNIGKPQKKSSLH